jgi:hypothetical protein
MNPNASRGTATAVAEAADEKLVQSELERARLYLEQTRCCLVGATRGLSDAQWNFKPAPHRWSIAEILEHLIAVQEFVLGPVRGQLAASPVFFDRHDYGQVDEIVMNKFPNRLKKFQTSEALYPVGQWAPPVLSERLLSNHGLLLEYLESTPHLRRHMVESPPLKAITNGAFESMDGYQWVLGTAAHNERHTKQILEIRADTNFPV